MGDFVQRQDWPRRRWPTWNKQPIAGAWPLPPTCSDVRTAAWAHSTRPWPRLRFAARWRTRSATSMSLQIPNMLGWLYQSIGAFDLALAADSEGLARAKRRQRRDARDQRA
ncbi:MAG: hypothetical protein R3A10_05480 [Caldilineaceae bacterium]